MSLEAKMSKISKYGMIVVVAVLAVIVLYSIWFVDSCPIMHMTVVNELKQYTDKLEPELCDNLVSKIIELNEKCGIEIEPIDCG